MSFTKQVSKIASAEMPINEKWVIRRCRYENGDGPRLCIATGTHGDEVMGQLILFGIAQRIKSHPDALSGTLDLYPMLNPLGLDLNERMVPSQTRLDMNRAFPGYQDGTPLEHICYSIIEDMKDADLVLDIHASTNNKSELYEVRMNASSDKSLLSKARSLLPELIWIYPSVAAFNSSLTGALTQLGVDAFILEVDERHRNPLDVAQKVIDGIFCKMTDMGLWHGPSVPVPSQDKYIPIIRSRDDICRITCKFPGIYVPENHIGSSVSEGIVLGTIIDALEGTVLESIVSPCKGLVFSQRSYSAVYPGTLLSRILKED